MANENRSVNQVTDPNVHTVASYNMSFASDLGKPWGSEKHFIHDSLKRAAALGLDDSNRAAFKRAAALGLDDSDRSSWERAAQLVRHFWMNEKNSSAMGFQEMNTSTKLDKIGDPFAGGDRRLQEILSGLGLEFYSANVESPYGFPTVVTAWKKDKLGEIMSNKEGNIKKPYKYVADLGKDGEFSLNKVNIGRPISIVHTTKGFTLINLHGPNVSAQSHTHNMIELRKAINTHVNRFVRRHNIRLNPNKLFIMGDFNDPFNAINREHPLLIDRTRSLLHYNTEADGMKKVKSCCYNFNSACPVADLNPTNKRVHKNVLENDIVNNQGYQIMADEHECFIRESENPAINQRIWPGTVKKDASDELDGKNITGLSVGQRGHLANYQFTGDYVMGANVIKSLQTYRPAGFRQDVSLESDHEMVHATFTSESVSAQLSGGARRTRHKKNHKQRQTLHKKNHKQRRTRHKKRHVTHKRA